MSISRAFRPAPPSPASVVVLAGLTAATLVACGDDGGADGGGGPGTSTSTATATVTTTGGGDGGAGGGGSACAESPQALADCVDPGAYEEDLAFVAEVRPPGSPHWQAVQELCAARLEEHGYEVELHDYGTGVNVLGRRAGTTTPEETVVVGAHYDGVEDCAGADDNASGVAATLEIARLLAQVDHARTVLIACWDEEELGLVGATAFVEGLAASGEDVVANFTFDTVGYSSTEPGSQTVPNGFDAVFPEAYAEVEANDFRGDFIAVIASAPAHADAVAVAAAADRIGLRQALLEIPEGLEGSPAFGDLRRSDHAPFWDAGIPAVFLTDTADFRNPGYHCYGGPDEVADLDLEFAVGVTRATLEATAIALGM